MKRYCIFDMDGTLVDSMGYWTGLGRDYLRALGIEPTEEELALTNTMNLEDTCRFFMERYGLHTTPEEVTMKMEQAMERHYRQDITLKPGVVEYLDRLKGRGARLCIATATNERLARICLAEMGIQDRFDFLLSCDTMKVSKNQPDIYLAAARRLGAAPEEIAVFEDAAYAAQTARDAGFYVVGVYDASNAQWQQRMEQTCHQYHQDLIQHMEWEDAQAQ